jgi:hypothetical protein
MALSFRKIVSYRTQIAKGVARRTYFDGGEHVSWSVSGLEQKSPGRLGCLLLADSESPICDDEGLITERQRTSRSIDELWTIL